MKQDEKNDGYCVIIPTYNNENTLADVINGVLEHTSDVIVVNDGSTDNTAFILTRFPKLQIINIPVNTGKGWALREGFKLAIKQGFRYAVTIDSDGQHFPDDLPLFLDLIAKEPDSIILGARNMMQDGVPGTSSFGHNFSIFWFKVETGIRIADVQTGFRLYPLNKIKEIKRFFTKKYEFEVEVLVRLAWRNVKILSLPVKVYYAPKEIRVSHFRKFRDFTRVSITNSLLVFMALLWVRPVAFFRSMGKKSLREFIREYIVNSEDSNARLASSVALGLFIGVAPLWGWQIVTTIGLAHLLKLNKFVAVTASNISLPPILPLILFLSYLAGGWILGVNVDSFRYNSGINFQWIKENLFQYIIGSLALGISLALVFGALSFFLFQKFRKSHV
ncbi:MAG: DUF2062 domain-containing protein [Bacteroidota bacterium]